MNDNMTPQEIDKILKIINDNIKEDQARMKKLRDALRVMEQVEVVNNSSDPNDMKALKINHLSRAFGFKDYQDVRNYHQKWKFVV